MKGQLRQRTPGSWSLVIYLGRDAVTQKKKYKWHTVRGTKKQAQQELNRLLVELQAGAYIDPAKATVGEFLKRWVEDHAKGQVSGITYERYEELVRLYLVPGLGGIPLAKLTAMEIEAFYAKALQSGRLRGKGGLSPQTVYHLHATLRNAFRQAKRWKLIRENPMDEVTPPRVEKRERPTLTTEETMKLLNATEGTELYYPVLLAVTTGLRRGEVLGLRWEDLNPKAGTLSIRQALEETKEHGLRFKAPKTPKSRRLVDLPDFVAEELRQLREQQLRNRAALDEGYQDHGLVICKADGSPCSPGAFSDSFRHMMKRAEVRKVAFHDLRHTHATLLLEQGIHPKVVSERLGHSSVAITMDRYSHVIPGMGREAARRVNEALSQGRRGAVKLPRIAGE